MNINYLYSCILSGLFFLAGCSGEAEIDKDLAGEGSIPDSGQEVVLSLKNTLVLKSSNATKAEGDAPIALEAENYISSLDVYVFASDKEDGEYTFQELFYYRDDATQTINQDWAHPFSLTPSDDGKSSTGLLRLTKGLFVKLYCIANQTTLYSTDAATGLATAYTTFQPLLQTAPGQADNVVTPGKPTLKEFEQLHTPLINPATASDVLVSPLPMTGAYIVPLDLTDFTVSARLRAGIKLTRMVARFDVINDSDKSKFKVTGISLANGRKGTTFFPVKPLGKVPADLITYPYRKVTSAQKASNHTDQLKGAFYSYPSLKDDGGYLILKGIYYPNKTEEKEVLYRVPFKQVVDGNGGYLEISPNHRYTVAITQADEYHLELNFTVADWSDDGSIDDYEPDNSLGEFTVTIPDGSAGYIVNNAATRTVTIRKDAPANSTFTVSVSSNAEVSTLLTYRNNVKDAPWLNLQKATKEGTPGGKYITVTTYTFSLTPAYTGKGHPGATLRITDKATGNEQLLYIRYDVFALTAVSKELDISADSKTYNKIDVSAHTATMYRMNDSRLPLSILCPDEIEAVDVPACMEVTPLPQEGDEHIFLVTLKDKDAVVTDNQVKLTFVDPKNKSRKEVITVTLVEADVKTTVSTATSESKGITTETTASGKLSNVIMPCAVDNSFTVTTKSTTEVSVNMNYGENAPHWLESQVITTKAVSATEKTIKFKIASDEKLLVGAKPVRVTLKGEVGSADNPTFTVTPKWLPSFAEGTSTALQLEEGAEQTIALAYKYYGDIKIVSGKENEGILSVQYNEKDNTISIHPFNATGGNTVQFRVHSGLLASSSLTATDYVKFTVQINKADRVASSDKVKVKNLYWTKGNLISDGKGGCKVGSPTDYGYLFRWGSLVGYSSGGTAGDTDNGLTPAVRPEEYVADSYPAFPQSPYADEATYGSGGMPRYQSAKGVGDPCSYYLGSTWRLPRDVDFINEFEGDANKKITSTWTSNYNNTGIAGSVIKDCFFPATGYRDATNGLVGTNNCSCYWTSVALTENKAYALRVYPDDASGKGVYIYTPLRSQFGFSIRCVQEVKTK